MGLLDNVLGSSFDDPRTAATLQLAQGLLSSPRMMQGLAGGLSGYQQAMAQAKQAKAVEEMRQMQLQQMQMQMAAQRQQQEQAQLDREGFQRFLSPVAPIEANAASGITGPRPEALKAVGQLPPLDPRLMAGFQMSPDAIKQTFEISQLGVKQPMKLGAGEAVFSPDGKMLFGNPKEDTTDPFIRMLKQSGIDPMSPMGQQMILAKIRKDTTHAPGTTLSVNTAQNPFFKGIGDFGAKRFEESTTTANEAAKRIEQNRQIAEVLNSGKFYSGTGAEVKLAAGKALQAVGVSLDPDAVRNTELLGTQLAQRTLNSIRASGLGAGQGFTDKDREFLSKAVGGSIELTGPTLARLVDLDNRAAQATIRKHNRFVQPVAQTAAMNGFPMDFTVPEPELPVLKPVMANPAPAPAANGWAIRPVP